MKLVNKAPCWLIRSDHWGIKNLKRNVLRQVKLLPIGCRNIGSVAESSDLLGKLNFEKRVISACVRHNAKMSRLWDIWEFWWNDFVGVWHNYILLLPKGKIAHNINNKTKGARKATHQLEQKIKHPKIPFYSMFPWLWTWKSP